MPDASWSAPFLTAAADHPRLRIGLIVDPDLAVTTAQASIVEDLLAADFVGVVDVFVMDAPPQSDRDSLAWRAYRSIDTRRIRAGDASSLRSPVTRLVASVDLIRLGAENARTAASSAGRRPTVGTEARLRPDLVVDLTAGGAPSSTADLARDGMLAMKTAVRLRRSLVMVSLEWTAEPASSPVQLDAGTFALDPLAVGPSLTSAAFGSTHLVIKALRAAHAAGSDGVRSIAIGRGAAPTRRSPTGQEVVRVLGPLIAGRYVGRIRRAVTRRSGVQHWGIALRTGASSIGFMRPSPMAGFEWLEAPRGHAWADPFLVARDGRTWLFYEDYSYAERRGAIACAEVTAEGGLVAPTTVLASAGHLSYPYVFVDGDAVFMIPESAEEAVVRLYRAEPFPTVWRAIADLYRGNAVDTSVWHDGARWWFFTTVREPRGGASALMLFSAATLTGEWEPHPGNPISLDVRDARGAGHIHRHEGRLIRPSQDGSRTYGFAFALNEILELTSERYRERRLVTIEPDWSRGLEATHTYARLEPFEATDGRLARDRTDVV
jgi:hypothetical protein